MSNAEKLTFASFNIFWHGMKDAQLRMSFSTEFSQETRGIETIN